MIGKEVEQLVQYRPFDHSLANVVVAHVLLRCTFRLAPSIASSIASPGKNKT
jgi:hypothetical protein